LQIDADYEAVSERHRIDTSIKVTDYGDAYVEDKEEEI